MRGQALAGVACRRRNGVGYPFQFPQSVDSEGRIHHDGMGRDVCATRRPACSHGIETAGERVPDTVFRSLSIQRGAYITTECVVTYAPPVVFLPDTVFPNEEPQRKPKCGYLCATLLLCANLSLARVVTSAGFLRCTRFTAVLPLVARFRHSCYHATRSDRDAEPVAEGRPGKERVICDLIFY